MEFLKDGNWSNYKQAMPQDVNYPRPSGTTMWGFAWPGPIRYWIFTTLPLAWEVGEISRYTPNRKGCGGGAAPHLSGNGEAEESVTSASAQADAMFEVMDQLGEIEGSEWLFHGALMAHLLANKGRNPPQSATMEMR